ncbi:MAG: hypothetical protein ABL875_05375, partial [Candidatus Nitrotoga sp.]
YTERQWYLNLEFIIQTTQHKGKNMFSKILVTMAVIGSMSLFSQAALAKIGDACNKDNATTVCDAKHNEACLLAVTPSKCIALHSLPKGDACVKPAVCASSKCTAGKCE